MKKINEAVVVSVSLHGNREGLLIVGKDVDGRKEVINAFTGEEAWALYEKLTIKKGEPKCL